MLGRRFRDSVTRLGACPEQVLALNGASSALHAFWDKHREFLGSIRQALAAHREHDALLYLEKLETLDPMIVMRIAAEFSEHLERLIAVLIDLAGLTVGMQAILNDMRNSQRPAG